MSVLLRRICTVALVASVAGMGLIATGCQSSNGGSDSEVAADPTPVIIGLSVARVGGSTVGVVATPENDSFIISEVETSIADKEFTLQDSATSTKGVVDDAKANPGNYVLVVDENKKINLVAKAK